MKDVRIHIENGCPTKCVGLWAKCHLFAFRATTRVENGRIGGASFGYRIDGYCDTVEIVFEQANAHPSGRGEVMLLTSLGWHIPCRVPA